MVGSDVPSNIPNGGWGWMVVAAVALINMFNQSILSVFGLLFGDHLQSMNQETTGAALVTNLNSLALNFSGLFIGPAIKNFSPRIVAFTGCLLTSSGLLMCALSTQLWHVIIGYSLFVGIGLGLIAPSTFMAINSYFTTRRGRAVGIAMAGTGVGQMIIPHIVRILLDHYGFRTTVMVMSGLSLLGLIGACMFRPLKPNKTNPGQNVREVKLLLDRNGEKEKNMYEVQVIKSEEMHMVKRNNKASKLCKKIFKSVAQAMDLELLKDPIFWNIIIGMGLVYTATTNFSMLFPYFLQSSAHVSRTDTAHCMSVLAGADIVSRLLLPFLTDKFHVPYRVIFLLGTIGLLIGRAVIAESYDLTTLLAMSAFYGSVKAATVINNNLTISAHCKADKLAGGLGLNMISKGVLVITIGQLLGWFRDHSGSYSLCLHAQNILLFVVISFWAPELIYKHFKNRKNRNNSDVCNSIP